MSKHYIYMYLAKSHASNWRVHFPTHGLIYFYFFLSGFIIPCALMWFSFPHNTTGHFTFIVSALTHCIQENMLILEEPHLLVRIMSLHLQLGGGAVLSIPFLDSFAIVKFPYIHLLSNIYSNLFFWVSLTFFLKNI